MLACVMTLVLTPAAAAAASESVPKYGESAATDADDMLRPGGTDHSSLKPDLREDARTQPQWRGGAHPCMRAGRQRLHTHRLSCRC